MKKLLAFALLTISTLAHAEVQHLDSVAAIVNKGVVLESELDNRTEEIEARARTQGIALPPKDVLQSQVLDQLVTERLQLEVAQRYGVQISDTQINAALQNMQKRSGLTQQQFYTQLQREGVTRAALREKIRRNLTIRQVQRGVVRQRIHISEQEVDNFLSSSDGKFWMSPEYHLGHILISLPQAPATEEVTKAKQQAQELYQRLQGDTVFAEVAMAESDGRLALKGGDLGWRRTSELPSLFAKIVPTLEPGEVSKPHRSNAGFHILKLYETRGEQEQEVVTQNHSRHILIKPSAILTDAEAKAKLEEIRQKILDGEAEFAAMAKEHSEDIGSALQGGDLGWANPGQFVPEFEQLVNTLPIGEISEPFKTQFGWHIIQVQDRRQENMTEELIRYKARNMLMNRHFEDELQLWQRELRDEAYIVIKLDGAGQEDKATAES